MIRKQQGLVEWLEFELFADSASLVHGVFLRHGGVSQGPYASLNVGGSDGDDPRCIAQNRMRIQKAISLETVVSAYQIHSDSVMHICSPPEAVLRCDALVTNQNRLALMIKHADCQAAIFYDPTCRAIANVHCGWRGNVKNIYRAVVVKMQQVFGCLPDNILVGISPSLGPGKAEFIHYRTELPEAFWSYQIKPAYFDLWAIARMQLEEAGILPHHIEIASICTYEQSQDFFSYRRDNRIMGNHATVVALT